MTTSEAERVARAVLTRRAQPGDAEVHRAMRASGVERAARLVAAGADDAWQQAEADLARVAELGGRLVSPGDAEWPSTLDDLGDGCSREDPGVPFALWVLGPVDLAEVCRRSVALVGARAATSYGTHMASLLAAGSADRGFTVVSGGAYGVDAAAHRAALVAGGVTVVVLASGIDVPYPKSNASLLSRVAATGLLVTEAPPGGAPWRQRFLSRNRLIAALTSGTVIVEAGLRSGALNTARHARRLGRPLMGVPGPATSELSAGVHAMLREHPESRLVTSAAEVAEEAGAIGELSARRRGAEGVRDTLPAALTDVLDAVPAGSPQPASSIAASAAWPVASTRVLLEALRDHGLIEESVEGFRLTALGRAPAARTPSGPDAGVSGEGVGPR